jgi:hypothetical protein
MGKLVVEIKLEKKLHGAPGYVIEYAVTIIGSLRLQPQPSSRREE